MAAKTSKNTRAKKSAAKKPAREKATAKIVRSNRHGHLARLVAFLESTPARPVGKRVALNDPPLAPLLALAAEHDAGVHAFLDLLAREHTSFCVFDVEMYPEQLLRGKRGEPWNDGAAVVGADDICLGRNGAGDIYVWNAKTGQVRFLIHDEGWRQSACYEDVDRFVEAVLEQAVESIDPDALDEADAAYRTRLRFAVEQVDEDVLDEDARAKLEELGLIE
jgi:hypothetical protein